MTNPRPRRDTFYKTREEIKLMLDLKELRRNNNEMRELILMTEKRFTEMVEDLRRQVDELKGKSKE